MDSSGWLYVPAACKTGTRCRLHVALHGCEQGQDYLPLHSPPGGGLFYGETFVRHAGYARWAETNRIVVLFPQAVSIPGLNPNGCWDWWGYTDSHFADNRGVQMRAIRNMIDRLASGANQ
jgi:poly(3-hydroxybutyrate) depolymerase